MAQRNVNLRDDQWQEIDALARALNTSGNAILRNVVEYWQKTHDPRNPFGLGENLSDPEPVREDNGR